MHAYERAIEQQPDRRLYAPLFSIYQMLGEEQKLNQMLDLLGRGAPEGMGDMLETRPESLGPAP